MIKQWECISCHAAGSVRYTDGETLFALLLDGTRGRKVGKANSYVKWISDRFGEQLVCIMCGGMADPDQISISKTTTREDVRFWLATSEGSRA